ncbi:unnamed protein product [Sphenostylis stenocarpa]|uniref:Uncharacterized protein n=1 Tax=Sphenostylis stenocarpa TaxID=92480 RepID=A0AA86RY35_9FABA|nr:unnamed protein product [Sphenostylis stenocarpa]
MALGDEEQSDCNRFGPVKAKDCSRNKCATNFSCDHYEDGYKQLYPGGRVSRLEFGNISDIAHPQEEYGKEYGGQEVVDFADNPFRNSSLSGKTYPCHKRTQNRTIVAIDNTRCDPFKGLPSGFSLFTHAMKIGDTDAVNSVCSTTATLISMLFFTVLCRVGPMQYVSAGMKR